VRHLDAGSEGIKTLLSEHEVVQKLVIIANIG
jgi:hypothetical protein